MSNQKKYEMQNKSPKMKENACQNEPTQHSGQRSGQMSPQYQKVPIVNMDLVNMQLKGLSVPYQNFNKPGF